MTSHTRVLLVGQHPESLAALRRTCDSQPLEVIGEAGFGPAALTWARASNPAIIAVVAEEPLARPLATLQVLTQGIPPWTVVAVVDRFELELVRKLLVAE